MITRCQKQLNSNRQRDVSAIEPFQKKKKEKKKNTVRGGRKRLNRFESLQYLATYLKDIGADPGVHYKYHRSLLLLKKTQ